MATPPFPDDLPVASIPRISLAKLQDGDATVCTELLDACCDQGFVLLDLTTTENGRKILAEVNEAFSMGDEFFASDLEVKKEFKWVTGNTGYKPLGALQMKLGKADLTELCAVSRDAIKGLSDTVLPDAFRKGQPKLQQTTDHLHSIATLILKILANQLEIPETVVDDMHKPESPSSTQLRFLHYPPQAQPEAGQERQQSLLGHTDSGSLTVLFTKIGGLQIMPAGADENDESAWRWVRPEAGCAIINVGDPLVQWTGGILRSAFHRVLYAPGAQATLDRYSFGYFLKPANDARMYRLQTGSVIPKLETIEDANDAPQYKDWHLKKAAMIQAGDQSAIFRGGIGRPVKSAAVTA